jgi:peptidoglycan/LPS O-acetylase OafA/YrhL
MKYYPEIDGLRAVSVMSVVFYHMGYAWMPGGFVGVDVFFVISGFLITSLLEENYNRHGRMFLFDFYIRRMKRLGPALLVMICLCILIGYFMLAPGDYRVLALSSLYALVASSNFYFLYNTGYFDVSSQSIALLHTWSLAIEEHFYIVWPAALWLTLRAICNNRKRLLSVLAISIVISFGLNIHALGTTAMSGFYLAHNRAWELLIGAFLALWGKVPNERLPRIVFESLALLGISAILYASAAFTKDIRYPGYYAALPVLGTVAFLIPHGHTTLVYRLLKSRAPVLAGKASYSIYLYHWPILIFWLHFSSFEPLTGWQRFILVVASCILGFLSWNYIERPFRHTASSTRQVVAACATCGLVLVAACSFIVVEAGLPTRLPAPVYAMSSFQEMFTYGGCIVPTPTLTSHPDCETGRPWSTAQHRIVLFGDSNAAHFLPVLTAAAAGHDISIHAFFGCSPVIDGNRTSFYNQADPLYNQNCKKLRDSFMSMLHFEPRISVIVFASGWWYVADHIVPIDDNSPSRKEAVRNRFRRAMDDLLFDTAFLRLPIALISSIPGWHLDPIPCVLAQETSLLRKHCFMNTNTFSMENFNQHQKITSEVLREYDGKNRILVISPEDFLCKATDCRARINGQFLYADRYHLRRNLEQQTLADFAKLLHFDDIIAVAERDAPRLP